MAIARKIKLFNASPKPAIMTMTTITAAVSGTSQLFKYGHRVGVRPRA